MANRQLVDYIKEQLRNGIKQDQLRTLLATEGWAQQDVEDALAEANSSHARRTADKHNHRYVAVTVLGIVVLLMATALFLVVFQETEPDVIPTPTPKTNITPNPGPTQLTGWAVCANEEDSIVKDRCYQDINLKDELFDCDTIRDEKEQGFCYRAKETVLLDQYAA